MNPTPSMVFTGESNKIDGVNYSIMRNFERQDELLDLQGTISGDVSSEIFTAQDYIEIISHEIPGDRTEREYMDAVRHTGWIRDASTMAIYAAEMINKALTRLFDEIEFDVQVAGMYVQQHERVLIEITGYTGDQQLNLELKLSIALEYALGKLIFSPSEVGGMVYSESMFYSLPARHLYITCKQIEPNFYSKANEQDPAYRQVLSTDFQFTPASHVQIPTGLMTLMKYKERFDIEFYNEKWTKIKNPFDNIIIELFPQQNPLAAQRRERNQIAEERLREEKQTIKYEQAKRQQEFQEMRAKLMREKGPLLTRMYYQGLKNIWERAVLKGDQQLADAIKEKIDAGTEYKNPELERRLKQIEEKFGENKTNMDVIIKLRQLSQEEAEHLDRQVDLLKIKLNQNVEDGAKHFMDELGAVVEWQSTKTFDEILEEAAKVKEKYGDAAKAIENYNEEQLKQVEATEKQKDISTHKGTGSFLGSETDAHTEDPLEKSPVVSPVVSPDEEDEQA